jgi:hypothetical protein
VHTAGSFHTTCQQSDRPIHKSKFVCPPSHHSAEQCEHVNHTHDHPIVAVQPDTIPCVPARFTIPTNNKNKRYVWRVVRCVSLVQPRVRKTNVTPQTKTRQINIITRCFYFVRTPRKCTRTKVGSNHECKAPSGHDVQANVRILRTHKSALQTSSAPGDLLCAG